MLIEPRLHQRDQLLFVLRPHRVVDEARILAEFGPSDRGAQIAPQMVVRSHHADVLPAPLEDRHRHDRGAMRGASFGVHLPAMQVRGRYLVAVEIRIQQGDVEELALSGALAVQQRAGDRRDRMHARHHIADRHMRQDRRASVVRVESANYRRIRSADEIEAGQRRQLAGLAERGQRAHHDSRIDLLDHVVTQPHPLDRSGAEVFDEHVHGSDQPLYQVDCARLFQIQAQAFLAQVVLYEMAAAAVFERRQGARPIADRRDLDLDYLRAHLGQKPRGRGPGDELGDIEHPKAAQHVLWFLLRHLLRLKIRRGCLPHERACDAPAGSVTGSPPSSFAAAASIAVPLKKSGLSEAHSFNGLVKVKSRKSSSDSTPFSTSS